MFIRCEESTQPGIIVEEGSTFTLSAQQSREFPDLVTNLRPRTTAALLVAAGRPPSKPLRLSDASAFERVQRVDASVDLHGRDEEDRVAGYSVQFLSRILDALDPDSRTPPETVELRPKTRATKTSGCGCNGGHGQPVAAAAANENQNALSRSHIRNLIVAPVPKFIATLNVHFLAPYLSDIVVKPNATLVLDGSVRNLIARNVYCYSGSRIVQQSGRLNVDITGVLRGGIPEYVSFYTAADILKIRTVDLQQVAAVNP
jgi:hypothetical protein